MAEFRDRLIAAMLAIPDRKAGTDEQIQRDAMGFNFMLNRARAYPPRAQTHRSAKGRRDEIHKIGTLAAKLFNALDNAKGDTLSALQRGNGNKHPMAFQDDVERFLDDCEQAYGEARDNQPVNGRPGKPHAEAVASLVLMKYESLTGKRATVSTSDNKAGGPFLQFLAEVFSLYNIDASAESQGRLVTERRRQGPIDTIKAPMATIRRIR